MRLIVIVMLFIAACPTWAQEFSGLGGPLRETDSPQGTFSWQLEYREGLGEHLAYSITYLNEGHVPNHHRDGHSVQLWARTNVRDGRLSLAAGVGPYFHYNTTAPRPGAFEVNNHGWGALTSLSATWHTESRWLLQLRANWVGTDHGIDTVSALLGIGYRLGPPPSPGPLATAPPGEDGTTGNEITLFLGETSVHNEGSAHSAAAAVEYRRGLWRHAEWTVAWLHEGENDLVRRSGLVTQLWGAKAFLDDRLHLGIGGGAYLAVDRLRGPQDARDDDPFVTPVLTMTGGFRFHPRWGTRVSWHRILTDYDRDADVFLAGVGYRF